MSWVDTYRANRDRWLSNRKFQRWAAGFPLTSSTARRRARALFDLCAGFVYSQILFACVRLKLFDILAEGPRTANEIAVLLRVPVDAAQRLLEAAASLRLVERRPAERFGLGHLGAAVVGNPAVAAMVEHHRMLYSDLRDPVGLLRGDHGQTELSRYWSYSSGSGPMSAPSDTGLVDYTTLMADSQALVADEILDAYPLSTHRCLLDIGGGDGSFLIEAGKRHGRLALALLDLPPVAQRAAQRLAANGLAERARVHAGDFRSDPLPRGADVISLVRVVHDHDDEVVSALLRASCDALPARGVLLLAEPMKGTTGAEPVADAYFAFYLLAMGQGRPRTPQTLQRMLREAGFAESRLVRTRQPLQTRLIVARKARAPMSVKRN